MRTKVLALVVSVFGFQFAYAENCKLEIKGNDQMQYDKKELTVDSTCKEIELKLTHVGKFNKTIMGHNWVLFETKKKADVLKSGEKAGPTKDYAPDAALVIAATKLIGGGESATVKFAGTQLKKGGDYTYVCTMPGHAGLMIGKLIVK